MPSHRYSLRVDGYAAFGQVRGGEWTNFAHNSLASREGKTVSGSVTTKRLLSLRSDLGPRDWQIISTLSQVRVATGAQMQALHFGDVTRRRAEQRLTALVRLRVLARLPRAIGGVRAGSRGHVYTLDVAGQRLANHGSGTRSRRPRGVGTAFLTHALAVTEIHVRLVLAEREGQLTVARFVGEPGAWRNFFGAGGVPMTLKPDAYAVLTVSGFEDHWFLEVDLGTEVASTLARKCNLYHGYWQSGTEQARHEVFPRVLWLVPDGQRAALVARVIARQPTNAQALFAVGLHTDAVGRMLQGAGP